MGMVDALSGPVFLSLTENQGGVVFDRVEKPLDWLFEAWS
jgi:hypothetical protein